MANDLTNVIPQLLAQGLMALREVAIMPQLVNRAYDSLAGERGSTIDVPIPSAIAVQDVTPANVPPSNTPDVAPTKVSLALNKWKEAPFYLTDKDVLEAMNGTIPMQASEAIKGLGNQVNTDILAEYVNFYGFTGTPGTTPFGTFGANGGNGDTSDATKTRTILNRQLAPIDDRHFVLDPDAEGNALNQRAFSDLSWNGSVAAIIDGKLNRKLGFNWWMHQLAPVHTFGTLSNAGAAHAAQINKPSGTLIGTKTCNISSSTLTGTVKIGDIFTVAGDTQTYVVTANATAASNAITGLAFEPAAKVEWADTAVITFKGAAGGTSVQNLAFHRDAIAFATRPLQNVESGLGAITSSVADPLSGLTLRLEVTREHKRTRYSYDILYGIKTIRREFGARLAG